MNLLTYHVKRWNALGFLVKRVMKSLSELCVEGLRILNVAFGASSERIKSDMATRALAA